MTTTIIHSDVIGTSYQHSRFDATRLRATRKFIVKSTRADIDDESSSTSTTIIADLCATTSTVNGVEQTSLGPRYVDDKGDTSSTNEIVHPNNNFLPLQTVQVQKVGDERYVIVADYYIVPGVGGGGQATAVELQLRVENYAKRTFKYETSEGDDVWLIPGGPSDNEQYDWETFELPDGVSPESFARVVMIPSVKLQVPFVAIDNPLTAAVAQKVGGLNSEQVTELGSVAYSERSIRFDGIQMDSYGGYETSGGQTYKYRGFYEFTARADNFVNWVATPISSTNKFGMRPVREGVQPGAEWTYSSLGIPS
jgi:hypothetical protein